MANDPDSSTIVDDSIPSPVSENPYLPPPNEDSDLPPGSRITFYIEAGFLFDGVAQSCDGEMLVEEYELSPSEGKNACMIGP